MGTGSQLSRRTFPSPSWICVYWEEWKEWKRVKATLPPWDLIFVHIVRFPWPFVGAHLNSWWRDMWGSRVFSQGSDTMTWLRLEHKPHQPGVQQTNRWDHCITILIWKLALTTWWGYVAVAAKIFHSEAITMYSLELYKEKENWKKKLNSGGNNSDKNNSTIFLAFQSDFQNYSRLHD